jgi:hypothetical protein
MNNSSVMPVLKSLNGLDSLQLSDDVVRTMMKHEQLLVWAAREWETRFPGQAYVPVWAAAECANNLARKRVISGRKLKGKARYSGYEMIPCPYSVPVNSFYVPGRSIVFTDSVGAFIFSFEAASAPFEVLYAAAHDKGSYCNTIVAVALVPTEYIETWADFERHCMSAVHRLERSEKVYIIGGADSSFKPTVAWEDVILPETLKADLRTDIETFFDKGIDLYKQLNLPPFRKLLLVGPPGTGKSMLCAALARLALDRKYVVIYISSADQDGNSFDKIQYALRIVANSQDPVVLVVEELDVYLKPEDKSQILNVLDGFESPNNPRGALLISTTNYPEIIDQRIAKRPGRVDRIIHIPPIQDEEIGARLLIRYMGSAWREEYRSVVSALIGQTGAFVREAALYARMLALNEQNPDVSVTLLKQSIDNLLAQLSTANTLAPQDSAERSNGSTEHLQLAADVLRKLTGGSIEIPGG